MQTFTIVDKYIVLKGTKAAEASFRESLSNLIINKFGIAPYTQSIITEILLFCQNYYIIEFENICTKETSYTFYKQVLWFHEQVTEFRHWRHEQGKKAKIQEATTFLPKGIDNLYISMYRRILKMILEQGCLVNMTTGEAISEKFETRFLPIADKLLFLGEMIFVCSNLIAEQTMIEDAIDISFDDNNLYKFGRRHHYEASFSYVCAEMDKVDFDYIVDGDGSPDFTKKIEQCFGFNYDSMKELLLLIHEENKLNPGDCIAAKKEDFLMAIAKHTEAPTTNLNKFFSGISLNRGNKMGLCELVKKPHSLNRYLYRPLLEWKIDQKEYYVFGMFSWYEAEISLYLNSIPWGKIPLEWEDNLCFKKYKEEKHNSHDKWLDDIVEKDIISAKLMYQRAVKKLVTKEKAYSIIGKDLGEIDFIIISPKIKKIFIAECKHLHGRYDMVNWKNDYQYFTVDEGKNKSYVSRIANKVNWLTANKEILEKHFQYKYKDLGISFEKYKIEGIFIINTPTFFMYNSDFRIHTFDQVKDVIVGKHIDPTLYFSVNINDDEMHYVINYPYFRKPEILYFEDEDDDCEVDKYGDPI